MTATMLHRGPDASGIWVCPKSETALGHRRLSIIDTSDAGTQPMASGDGRYVISFNGEIYNYLELRPLLEAKGSVFHTRTDTEVLIEAMRHWGPEGLARLDGMFAFALHDTVTGELLLARDAFGEKPLYFVANDRRFAFASELHALQTLPDFDFSVSTDAVAEYLAFQYIGAPRTFYRNASKLPPGHFMRVSPDGRIQTQRYFEFQPASTESRDTRPLAELAEECEEILVRSLRRRLIADVPLGAFLSGGVDSSTTVALATRVLGRTMKTFSIGFEDSPDSEHEIARTFARHLGTEHEDAIFARDQTVMAEQIGRLLDEPNGDTSCAPTYLLCGLARKHVTVAISGDGGDELFFGYGRHLRMAAQQRLFDTGEQLGMTLGAGYYSEQILTFNDADVRSLLGHVPAGLRTRLRTLRDDLDLHSRRVVDVLRKTDVENYLPGAVLAKVDRMSMQHSLEVRTPFLSIELARFAEKLPVSALHGDGVGKRILRHIAKKYLPAALVDLPKKGFGLPMTEWARESFMPRFDRLFARGASPLAEVIPQSSIERFSQRQASVFAPYQVWALSILGHYCTHHREQFAAPAPAPGELALQWADFIALPLLAELRKSGAPVLLLCVDELPAWFRSLPDGSVIVSRWAAENPETASPRFVQCAWDSPGALEPILAALRFGRPPRDGVFFGSGERYDSLPHALMSSLVRDCGTVLPTIDRWHYQAPTSSFAMRCERTPRTGGMTLLQRFASAFRGGSERALRRAPIKRAGDNLPSWKFAQRAAGVFVFADELPSGGKKRRRVLLQDGKPIAHASAKLQRQLEELVGATGNQGQLETAKPPTGETKWSVVRNRVVIATADAAPVNHGLHEYQIADSWRLFTRAFDQRPRWTLTESQHRPPFGESAAQWAVFEAAFAEFIRIDNETGPPPVHFTPRRAMMITWALASGGAERQFSISARHLRQIGVDVSTASLMPFAGHLAHYLPLLRDGNVPVQSITSPSPDFSFADALGDTPWDRAARRALSLLPDEIHTYVWNLYTYFTGDRPQAAYSQLDWPSICVALAGLLAGVPRVVLSFRGMSPERTPHHGTATGWHHRTFLLLRKSSRAVLSGNSMAGNDDYARWLGIPPSEIVLVRNGIETASLDDATDAAACESLRAELGIAPHEKVLLGVFRLDLEKRPDLFVDLASQLLAKFPDLVVLHAGGGSERDRIENALAERQLGRRFRLLGRRADTYTLMKIASVVCLTSEFEGTPNVALESMACGVQVVATNVSDNAYIVPDGRAGFVVESNDAKSMADRLVRLTQDRELRARMSREARAWVMAEFSCARLAEKTLAVYHEAVAMKRAENNAGLTSREPRAA